MIHRRVRRERRKNIESKKYGLIAHLWENGPICEWERLSSRDCRGKNAALPANARKCWQPASRIVCGDGRRVPQ